MKELILNGNKKVKINFNKDIDFNNFTRFFFNFDLQINSDLYSDGGGVSGDEALWFPLDESTGIKLIKLNNDFSKLSKNIDYIIEINSDIFPKINWYEKIDEFLIISMENIVDTDNNLWYDNYKFNFLPSEDFDFIFNELEADIGSREKCIIDFYKHNILPEDEWYKTDRNMISGKIVDFHRFIEFPDRYKFDSNGVEMQTMHNLYTNAINRYSTVLDIHGLPKWKGKIYQGFIFDNGFEMVGYKSPQILEHIPYDSYLKMLFVPFNKVKGGKVLDLGCNEGFLCYQSIVHGAEEAIGVDLQKEDIDTAKDLNDYIFQYSNVKFENGDAVDYIKNTKEKFRMVFLCSVLHQIYKNMVGSEEFLVEIKNMSIHIFTVLLCYVFCDWYLS